MLPNLGPGELILIMAIALIVFGPKKLPELGKGIGDGFRALKDSMKDHPAETTPAAPAATSAPGPDVKS